MVFTRGLEEVDATQVALVGGKGAQLGELARVPGVPVPPGFCVTTAAYRAAVGGLGTPDRAAVLAAPVPDGLVDEIGAALARLGPDAAYAVRSSATAEDLPSASFAGQHDSYLGVVGRDAVVEHVRLVWASLFGDRAVTYREQQGIGHDAVEMAVVVQRMVEPRAAGVLFTADPLSGNRSVATIDAVHGLADELVSGRATPDVLRVRAGAVVERSDGRPGAAGADRRRGAAAGGARTARRGARRRAAGRRVVPDPGRRVRARAGAPGHDALPGARGRRRRLPRLRLGRPRPDDDRPDATSRAVVVAADGAAADARGRRPAVRRRHRPAVEAAVPRGGARRAGHGRPAHRRRAAHRARHRVGAGAARARGAGDLPLRRTAGGAAADRPGRSSTSWSRPPTRPSGPRSRPWLLPRDPLCSRRSGPTCST